jgi:hypothetical protein
MREAYKFNIRIHNGNILMSSVTKDPGVSSILLFSGSGINFPCPLYSQSCGIFDPAFSTVAPLAFFLVQLSSPPSLSQSTVYRDNVWLGGGGGVLSPDGDHILHEFDNLYLAIFRTF